VGIDQQDVFVLSLNPENHNQVRWRNRWEDLRLEIDTIRVRGEAPRPVALKFSRFGPIVYEDSANHRAYTFRSVLEEPGTAGYLASLRVNQARNWEEYLDAMDRWFVPSENMIYADVDGNIGWQAAGLTPVRCCGWNGRLPAPGDGRYDWRGFYPMRTLPREYNPARGYIATANHNIMPPGYTPPLGYDWASPHRYRRIDAILSDSGGFTVEDFQRLQHDVYSDRAVEAVALILGGGQRAEGGGERGEGRGQRVEGRGLRADENIQRALDLLAAWDGRLERDSPAAALYRAWRDTVEGRVLQESGLSAPLRDSLVLAALGTAVARLETEQGLDWGAWRYGLMHQTRFTHPVTPAFDLPPVPRPGDGGTVNVTGQSGASFREIIDLAHWDNSVATSVPGQSGQPRSPHYGDLLPLWAEGEYFPLLYSREAIEANLGHRLVLRAGRAQGEARRG
jgi:penicillin amidase